MKTFLKNFWIEDDGAAAAEYALILAVVSGIIVVAATVLGDEIASAMANVACIIQQGTEQTGTISDTGTLTCADA